jgi:hypothetical protein
MEDRQSRNEPQQQAANHKEDRVSDLQLASQKRQAGDTEQKAKNQLNRANHTTSNAN